MSSRLRLFLATEGTEALSGAGKSSRHARVSQTGVTEEPKIVVRPAKGHREVIPFSIFGVAKIFILQNESLHLVENKEQAI